MLTVGLTKVSKKQAFLLLAFLFLAGQTLGALAVSYEMMMAARIITGVSSAACFGVALGICFDLVHAIEVDKRKSLEPHSTCLFTTQRPCE